MIQKYKIHIILGLLTVVTTFGTISGVPVVRAQPSSGDVPYNCYDFQGDTTTCPSSSTHDFEIGKCYRLVPGNQGEQMVAEMTCPNASPETGASLSPGGSTSIDTDCDDPNGNLDSENCGIISYIVTAINILSALAGMAIVGSMMIAGYQYMTARDNAGQIQKAKMRIVWALIALAVFVFMYAILNYLVPGGVI